MAEVRPGNRVDPITTFPENHKNKERLIMTPPSHYSGPWECPGPKKILTARNLRSVRPSTPGAWPAMKAGVLLGFAPLIAYGVLAGIPGVGVTIALAAATIITVLTGFSDLKKGMILTWASLVLFTGLLIAALVSGSGGILYAHRAPDQRDARCGCNRVHRRRAPFTLPYAREMVDRAVWESPVFIRTNVRITGAWGGVFLINLGLNAITFARPGPAGNIAQVLTYIVLAAGIIFTIRYPEQVRKKYGRPPVQDVR